MAQRKNWITALYDSEGSLESEFALSHHVNLGLLLYNQPDSLEQAFKSMSVIMQYVEEKHRGVRILFALDSLAAFPAYEETIVTGTKQAGRKKVKGAADHRTIGLRRAAIIANAMRRLNTRISRGRHIFLFTNQTRDQIEKYGDPDVTCGGRSVKFHCAIRLGIRKGAPIRERKGRKRILGWPCKAYVKKSKVGIPFREANFFLPKDGKISRYGGYLDFLVDEDMVVKRRRKSGQKERDRVYTYGEEEFLKREFRTFLKAHRELR